MTGHRPEGNGAADDLEAIADVTRTFFAAFVSGPDCAVGLQRLREVLLPEAVIIRTGGDLPVIYGVDAFIAPRQALLTGGTLTEFSEWELAGRTDVFGDIAHRFCGYAKTGVQDGVRFTARGMKTLQFVRTPDGWRISAVAWDDERDGLALPFDAPRDGGAMAIVRSQDRPVVERGPELPTLQRLVDRANGSDAVTVLVNTFTHGERVPEHTHEVEEVLVVTAGECVVTVDGQQLTAREGDAVIVRPGATHSIAHGSEGACTVVAVLGSADAKIWSE